MINTDYVRLVEIREEDLCGGQRQKRAPASVQNAGQVM